MQTTTEIRLLQLAAIAILIILILASTALAAIGSPYPEELTSPLHVATGWLFGTLSAAAIEARRKNGSP